MTEHRGKSGFRLSVWFQIILVVGCLAIMALGLAAPDDWGGGSGWKDASVHGKPLPIGK